MAGSVSTTVRGLRELGQNFAKLKEKTQRKLARKAVREAALLVRDAARANVASRGLILTGDMRDALAAGRVAKASKYAGLEVWSVGMFKVPKQYVKSAKNRRAGKAGKSWASTYAVDGPAYYWKFLEYGTVKYAPTPFLNPALEANVSKATDKIAEELRAGINTLVLR